MATQTQLDLLSRAQKLAGAIPLKDSFTKLFPFDKYFFNEQSTRNQGAYRTNKYFQPIREKGINDLQQGFANRGLFRSGIRMKEQTDYSNKSIGEEQAMQEDLFNLALGEAYNRAIGFQKDYEKNPLAFKKKVKPLSSNNDPFRDLPANYFSNLVTNG